MATSSLDIHGQRGTSDIDVERRNLRRDPDSHGPRQSTTAVARVAADITRKTSRCRPFSMRTFALAVRAAAVARNQVPVVALFALILLNDSIATSDVELAIGGATAVTASVGAVVTLFAKHAVHDAISAVRAELASGAAPGFSIRRIRREVYAIVALLVRILLDSITAIRASLFASGEARAIASIVDPVVANFIADDDAITTDAMTDALFVDESRKRQVECRAVRMPFGVE